MTNFYGIEQSLVLYNFGGEHDILVFQTTYLE